MKRTFERLPLDELIQEHHFYTLAGETKLHNVWSHDTGIKVRDAQPGMVFWYMVDND